MATKDLEGVLSVSVVRVSSTHLLAADSEQVRAAWERDRDACIAVHFSKGAHSSHHV